MTAMDRPLDALCEIILNRVDVHDNLSRREGRMIVRVIVQILQLLGLARRRTVAPDVSAWLAEPALKAKLRELAEQGYAGYDGGDDDEEDEVDEEDEDDDDGGGRGPKKRKRKDPEDRVPVPEVSRAPVAMDSSAP